MSVSKAIRGMLKDVDKTYVDLAIHIKKTPEQTNAKLSKGIIDKGMIKGIAEITDKDISVIKKVIDEARKEENHEISIEGKLRELEEKAKNYELAIELLNDKIKDKDKTLEIFQKTISDKDKTIEILQISLHRANKLIDKWEKEVDNM